MLRARRIGPLAPYSFSRKPISQNSFFRWPLSDLFITSGYAYDHCEKYNTEPSNVCGGALYIKKKCIRKQFLSICDTYFLERCEQEPAVKGKCKLHLKANECKDFIYHSCVQGISNRFFTKNQCQETYME